MQHLMALERTLRAPGTERALDDQQRREEILEGQQRREETLADQRRCEVTLADQRRYTQQIYLNIIF